MLGYVLLTAFSALSMVSGRWVDYERPSIYQKSTQYSVKVNGTFAKTVNFVDYDYIQLSMDEGYKTEFRIADISGKKITSPPIISPGQLPYKYRIENNELIFSLEKIHYIILKINGLKELVLMIDRMETDAPAAKGDGIFNVLDYGADATGKGITTGIQKALDAAAKKPGSIVYVPAGLYLIGHLMLRDRTALYLAGGSVLRFTGKKTDYKVLWTKHDLGDGTWWIQTEFDSKDIKVFGRGTIDGNAAASIKDKLIASMLVPVGTTNFKVDGILVRDSSFWAVTPIQVTGAKLTNLKILNNIHGRQNDGIDVVESTNVKVWRSIAVANDDSFSTKTWLENVGTTVPYPYPPRPLRDVSFDDCMAWTKCYGFKVGMGVYGDQDNVIFKNGVIYYASVALGIHHKFGTGTARNITYENMDIERLGGNAGGTGAWLALFIQNDGKGAGPIKGVTVKNVRARAYGSLHSKLTGYNEKILLDGVTLTDIYMLENKTAATTLEQMDVTRTQFSKNIKIKNSS